MYFTSSSRITGTPSDFSVILGNRVLTSRIGHTTRVMVTEASIPRTWYSLRQGANSFKLQPGNVTVALPVGYLNAIDLRAALQSALPTGWQVAYSRVSNKLTFTRPNNAVETYTFDLAGFPRQVLGFANDTVTFNTNSAPTSSDIPIRVNGEVALLLHMDLQKSAYGSMDNIGDSSFADSTILAKVPVNAAPFDNVVFSHEGELQWQEIVATHVDSLRVWLTDDSGVPIELPHDWSFTLVVEQEPRHSQDASMTALGDIRDVLKLMALSDKNITPQ